MKLKLFLILAVAALCISLVSCGNNEETTAVDDATDITEATETEPEETEPEETEPPHEHKYEVVNKVAGTCVEEGYEVYGCECGLSYKNLLPSAHSYTEQKDTTGKYVKKTCSLCGDYKIVRIQSYIHNVTFEGFTSVEKAVNAEKNLSFYAISAADNSGGKGEIRTDVDGSFMHIFNANFYIKDTSKTMMTKKFITSIDVMFEKFTDMELISYANHTSSGKWNYNSGVVKVTADGKLKFHGELSASEISLTPKGYTNITVVCDPLTTLCDVYVNEVLVRTGIKYISLPKDVNEVYIRYFDRKNGYSACADNLKMYVADTPEFIVPDGLIFKK